MAVSWLMDERLWQEESKYHILPVASKHKFYVTVANWTLQLWLSDQVFCKGRLRGQGKYIEAIDFNLEFPFLVLRVKCLSKVLRS